MGTVLYFWFVVKCGGHGWGNSQWSDCGIHRQERGMIDHFISTDYVGFSFTRLFLRNLRKINKGKKRKENFVLSCSSLLFLFSKNETFT